MNIRTKEIYSEVYQVLNLLGNEYIDKLPVDLINMLKQKREVNYNPQYTEDIPLKDQNIKKETITIIALLYLNYWCKDKYEKTEVKHILEKNEEEYQLELRKKYNPDDIFKNYKQENRPINDSITDHKEMIPYERSIIVKIINKIKNIFHIR